MSNTVQSIRDEFETILNNSTWWKRFIGSQFVSFLSLFVAQVVARCVQATDSALQNSFLALATRRAAILAGAEARGYVGAKAMPSIGTVIVKNNHTSRITLPSYTQLVAPNQVIYSVTDAIDIPVGASVSLPISQIETVTLSFTVEEEKSWLSVIIPSEYTEQIHNMVVRVNGTTWAPSFKFRNTGRESKVYMEYYKSTDQYGLRFGNGANGLRPSAGDVIEVDLWLTEGETFLLDGQALTLAENQNITLPATALSITTETQITGGAEPESIESIRNSALYFESYDEQIVWDGDYLAFIKASMSNIVWLSVWGEAEQEKLMDEKDLDNINTIFISAYAPDVDEAELGAQIIALFDGREGYNEKYRHVPRKDAVFTVNVKGIVYDSSNPTDAEKAVYEALEGAFGIEVKDKGEIYIKNIWAQIEALASAQGIESFSVEADGILTTIPIDTYQYIDMENSTIEFSYR